MSQNETDGDFGRLLQDFEREQEVRTGRKPSGRLVRTAPEPERPRREYVVPEVDEDFGAALAAFETEQLEHGRTPDRGRKRPEAGQIVTGTVVSLDLETALVDVGAKAEGVVRTDDLTDEDGVLLYAVGDRVRCEVVAGEGGLLLRPVGAGVTGGGASLVVGDVVDGTITSFNKGGGEVEIGARRAFCPFSQLDLRRVEEPEALLGRKLRFEVQKADGRDLVVSRRALLERERREQAERVRAGLEVGAVIQGTVSALEAYGAFVDLGGLEGLVHVSELSYRRVEHPKELLRIGQQVDVRITRLETTPEGQERVSLSMKALERDPWLDLAERWPEGTVVRGRVARLESFGAFVELMPGVDGLAHISELGGGRRLNHPREVLQQGQELAVRVLGVDTAKRRISLAPADDAELGTPAVDVDAVVDRAERSESTSGSGFGSLAASFKKARKT
ncbi:MAG: S1 RNA-binding domain-containing protein [Acidobacteriota bacterium]